jgi:hypothetical protein
MLMPMEGTIRSATGRQWKPIRTRQGAGDGHQLLLLCAWFWLERLAPMEGKRCAVFMRSYVHILCVIGWADRFFADNRHWRRGDGGIVTPPCSRKSTAGNPPPNVGAAVLDPTSDRGGRNSISNPYQVLREVLRRLGNEFFHDLLIHEDPAVDVEDLAGDVRGSVGH